MSIRTQGTRTHLILPTTSNPLNSNSQSTCRIREIMNNDDGNHYWDNSTVVLPGFYLNDSVSTPQIPYLDHQEIVQGNYSSSYKSVHATPSFPSVISTQTSNGLSTKATNDLFSFELDTNGLPSEFLNHDLEPPDFDWTDLLSDSDTPISLDEIDPSDFLSGDKIKSNNTNIYNISQSHPVKCVGVQNTICDEPKHSLSSSSSSFSSSSSPQKSCSLSSYALTNNYKLPCFHSLSDDGEFDDDDIDDDYEKEDIKKVTKSFMNKKPNLNNSINKCQLISLHNEDLKCAKPGQRLKLGLEERKMLEQMGISLPIKFPLNQAEERAVRTVRRKIRNKLSAQASRAKRQNYVIDLEKRLCLSNEENKKLRRHIVDLENDKRGLATHLRKLRTYVTKLLNKQSESNLPLFVNTESNKTSRGNYRQTTTSATAAGGTSLLVVTFMILMWTALVPFPKNNTKTPSSVAQFTPTSLLNLFTGRSRILMMTGSVDPESLSYSQSNSKTVNNMPITKLNLDKNSSPDLQKQSLSNMHVSVSKNLSPDKADFKTNKNDTQDEILFIESENPGDLGTQFDKLHISTPLKENDFITTLI